MKVFIARLSALGDVACSLPAAGSLKAAFPDCHITWYIDKRFAGLAECCQHIDQLVIADKGFSNIKKQVRNLGEFDLALDLQGLIKSALPVYLAQTKSPPKPNRKPFTRTKSQDQPRPTKLGYHWQREGANFLVSPVIPDPSSVHVVLQYLDVARAAGGTDVVDFGLAPIPEDIPIVQNILQESNIDPDKPLILANAGAGWAAKRWPPENFASLIKTLHQNQIQFAFIGTSADEPSVQAVTNLLPPENQPKNLLNKTNVRQLVALLDQASVILAGDTGAIHIGAALGKPCVGLYTQTRPERSCPFGQLQNCQSVDPHMVTDLVLNLARNQ